MPVGSADETAVERGESSAASRWPKNVCRSCSLTPELPQRHAEQLILEGRVMVNGAVITELGSKADSETDHIKRGWQASGRAGRRLVYLAMRTKDVMSTVIDPQGPATGFLRGVKARVYPVGRLDYSRSEGALAAH